VGQGGNRNGGIKAARGRYKPAAVSFLVWQGRPTGGTKAFDMALCVMIVSGDIALPGQPFDARLAGKQVSRMGRAGIFAAPLAVAEEKLLKIPLNFKCHFAAKARPFVNHKYLLVAP